MKRFIYWTALCFSTFCVGCNSVPSRFALPGSVAAADRQTVLTPSQFVSVRDQLIINSDVPLFERSPLLDEIVAQRHLVLNSLNLAPSKKPIAIYLFDGEARFKEFVRQRHPEYPDRRAFFVDTESELAVYTYWSDRVAEDLRHEVTHGYVHSVVKNVPAWLDEGLAEYFEVPPTQRGLNEPHARLLVGRMRQEGWRPNLAKLESIGQEQEMTLKEYAEAWGWVYYLLNGRPENRKLLVEYVAELNRTPHAASLADRLRESSVNPDALFAMFLGQLPVAAGL